MQNLLAILEEADMAKIRIFWQERKSKKVKLEVKSKSEKNSDNKVKSNCDNNRRNIDLFLRAT